MLIWKIYFRKTQIGWLKNRNKMPKKWKKVFYKLCYCKEISSKNTTRRTKVARHTSEIQKEIEKYL